MKTVTNVPISYDYQTLRDMKRVFQGIGFKEAYSPDTMHDFANAAAAQAVGEQVSFKETDDEYFLKLSKFLNNVNFAIYSGNSPLARAASLYVAMHNAGMLKKGSKQSYEQQKEQQKDEQAETDQDDPKTPGDKGEDQEKQDQDQELNDSDQQKGEPDDSQEEGEGSGGSEESEEPDFDFDEDKNAVDSNQSMDGMIDDFTKEPEKKKPSKSDDGRKESEKPPKVAADPEALANTMHNIAIKQRQFTGTAAAMYTRVDGIIPEMTIGKLDKSHKDLIAKLTIIKSRSQIQNHRWFTAKKNEKMTRFNQINSLADYGSMASPDFDLRFMRKNLRVGKKVPHGKQCAVYMIDSSGSMRTKEKMTWVRSIILDRYDQVLTGQAELYIVPYEGKAMLEQAIYISTKEDVRKHLNWMPAFNLGWTQIQTAVEEVSQEILHNRIGKFKIKGERPEIVVILDGDDEVGKTFKPLIKTHAFILGQKNQGVKAMCENSGGTYEEFWVRG